MASPLVLRWGTLAALLVLWEVLARTVGNPSFVAAPDQVLAALGPMFADQQLVAALGRAFVEIVVAFGLAIVVGVAAGIAIGWTDLGRRSVFPLILVAYGLPQVVVLPLFILVFGIGPPSRIAFGFTHGVLPVVVNTVAGMRGVSPLFLASARSQGASRAQLVRHVVFPTMVATVFTGLRLSMTLTLLGVILAELFVSTNGIGSYTQLFAETFKPAQLFALILVLATMAVLLNEAVRVVERRFARWREA